MLGDDYIPHKQSEQPKLQIWKMKVKVFSFTRHEDTFEEKINDFLVEKQNEGVPIEIIPTNNYVLIRYGYEVIK